MNIKRIAAVVFAIAALSAQAAKPVPVPEPVPLTPPKPIVIKSQKMVEKCLLLNARQTLEYEFKTSAKVNFNLHYHKGDAIYYPVKKDRTNSENDSYEAQVREEFCLMWENKTSTDVELNYSYKVRK